MNAFSAASNIVVDQLVLQLSHVDEVNGKLKGFQMKIHIDPAVKPAM